MFHLKKNTPQKNSMVLCFLIGLLPTLSFAQNDQETTKPENTVYFDTDSYQIRQSAKSKLTELAAYLKSHPDLHITLYGRADVRGKAEYNIALSELRANNVADYLMSLKIEKKRINTFAYGESRPTCSVDTEACYQKNRIVSFTLNKS